MRDALLVTFILFLSLGLATDARAQTQARNSADIDLGTATLSHREVALGPFFSSVGLYDRFMVGTYVLPWFASLAVPESVVPNLSLKAELFRTERFSASVTTNLFYARLGDLDGDGLHVRAFIWPVRTMLAMHHGAHTSSLELSGVYSSVTGSHPVESDTRVFGVAIARSVQAGVMHRIELRPWLSVWARMRVLIDHAPVAAEVSTDIGEMSLTVEARANSAELSSGVAGVVGLHLQWPRFALTLGTGYGTWFLPGLLLPIGQNAPIGELNFYFRF